MDNSIEYNQLKDILKSKGAIISNKIARIYKNNYYGLYASKKIKKGEILCKYKYNCSIQCKKEKFNFLSIYSAKVNGPTSIPSWKKCL